MLRTFKCPIKSNILPIHIQNEECTIDLILDGYIHLDCYYQVYDDEAFKQSSSYDITNAIHRNKIENELKQFICIKLATIPIEALPEGIEHKKMRELEVEIESSIQQFHLIKNGLSIIDIRIQKLEFQPTTQKKLDDLMKRQKQIKEIDSIAAEFKIFFPEFINEKEDKWICSCGKVNKTNFCPNCGTKRGEVHEKINLKL